MDAVNEPFGLIKRLLLGAVLFVAPMLIGIVGWQIYGLSNQMEADALRSGFETSVESWTLLLGNLLVILVFWKKRYVSFSLGKIEKQKVWAMIGIALLIGFAMQLFNHAWFALVDIESRFPEVVEKLNEERPMSPLVVWILYSCLAGPIAEEMIFRGVLLGGLLRLKWRPWLAILVSAVAFSLLHHPLAFVTTMFFAAVVGWLFWRTGSIVPGIIIHVVNNSFSFIETDLGTTGGILLLIACLVVIGGGMWRTGKLRIES